MGKNVRNEDSPEHRAGCIKGMLNHFHCHTLNFAKRRFPRRRITHGRWSCVDTDDERSGPSNESEESREKDDPVVVTKKSRRSRIKAKFRKKRSTSCPPQTLKIQNSPPTHDLEPLDKSSVKVDESATPPRSSPKVEEKVITTPCTCDLYAANEPCRIYSSEPEPEPEPEQSRLYVEALGLLNMRKELFLNGLPDPCSSSAQQIHEKRLTRSMSFNCARPRTLKAEDLNFQHDIHSLPLGDFEFLGEVENTPSYASTGEPNDQSMSLAVSSDEATPEQPQGHPKPTGNLSPVSPHLLNTQQDKVVIKRFKNLREVIRHAIKDNTKEKQHIIKDAILHKIPNDRKSKACKGQGDTSEKPPRAYMNRNREQKSFFRASSFNDSVERYNRLLEPDPGREAKGRESERPKLRTNVTPSPIPSIPKKLNRIYSSPDLGVYGLQSEEPLDFTCGETSTTSIGKSQEGNVISGKQTYSESNSNTENETQMDKISECESKGKFFEGGSEVSDKGSKYESQENIVDDGDGLDKMPKCEGQKNIVYAGEGQENFVGGGELLDKTLESDSRENIEDAADKPILGVASDLSSQEDVADPANYYLPDEKLVVDHHLLDGEDSLVSQQHELSRVGTAIYEIERGSSSTRFHETIISQAQVDKNSRLKFDYVKAVLDLSGFNRNESLGTWHSPGQPIDPVVLHEVEGRLLVQSESSEIEDRRRDHVLLFDLVNEVLLDIYHKSSSYWPNALVFCSRIHRVPTGYHVLEEVWADINCYLRWKPTSDQAYIEDGDAVEQDFAKYDGWMNLQFDSECVGLELEQLLFDDLINELLPDIQTSEIR